MNLENFANGGNGEILEKGEFLGVLEGFLVCTKLEMIKIIFKYFLFE